MAYRPPNRQNSLRTLVKPVYVDEGGDNVISERHDPLHFLRIVALIEGSTLFALVCIGLPLKHLLGIPAAVSILGPVHGLVFLFYLWMVVATAVGENWSRSKIALAFATAMLPFGAFVNAELLLRKRVELDRSCST